MTGLVHGGLMTVHIAGGIVALGAGTGAAAMRKGTAGHGLAGKWFFAAMIVLGVTAAMLEPYRRPPGSPLGGVMVCYFVATAWWAARQRAAIAGWPEVLACLVALGLGGAMILGAMSGATTPAGAGPIFGLGGVCLVAGFLDLSVVVRRRLSPAQRIARHVWRVCFAFFIATGSFFLGQQDVLPRSLRGNPVVMALAFAPFALMCYWLVALRLTKGDKPFPVPKSKLSDGAPLRPIP